MLHLCPNPARRYPTLPNERVIHDPGLSLATRCGTGREAIKNAVRELSAAGLLVRATMRQPSGQLNTVTLISDDPTMLLEELTLLSTRSLVDNAPPSDKAASGKGRQARHARPTEATETAPDGQNSRRRAACRGAAEHSEHYHHCVLQTTHIYIKSHMSRSSAAHRASAERARITQDEQ